MASKGSRSSGFHEEVPRDVNVNVYAEARADEMMYMAGLASTINKNTGPSQIVPRHMRRRMASHDVKRLPRRMRNFASQMMLKSCDGEPIQKPKTPSRKHRRRPSNLLQDYNRRKRKHIWLETHIWHAKRFKMIEQCSYKMALRPNDKGVRSAYRATLKYCHLVDISYHCCIELHGPQDDIVQCMSKITSSETGLTVGAKCYLSGQKEGECMIYQPGTCPHGAISPVWFIWQPEMPSSTESSENAKRLWVWCPPYAYNAFYGALAQVLGVARKTNNGQTADKAEGDAKTSAEEVGLTQDDPMIQGSLTVTSLKDRLCRFRLTGPLSQAVLTDMLKCSSIESSQETNQSKWWKDYFVNESLRGSHEKQHETWTKMKGVDSPAVLPPHCVVGLTVRDPRIFTPKKNAMVHGDSSAVKQQRASELQSLPLETSWSPIWLPEVRQVVKETKISEQELNKKRSQVLVPGSLLEQGDEESRVPVLLIQRPGHRPSPFIGAGRSQRRAVCPVGYACGWDLIVPSGWAMAFWIGMVYRGARVGGLRELESTAEAQKTLYYPNDYPDTLAGQETDHASRVKLTDKHNKMPPAKRPNFVKLGIPTPFHCPWEELLHHWDKYKNDEPGMDSVDSTCNADVEMKTSTEVELKRYICVLRNKKALTQLAVLSSGGNVKPVSTPAESMLEVDESGDQNSDKHLLNLIMKDHGTSLVAVNITMIRKGTPDQMSMICIPNAVDLEKLCKDAEYGGPLEPPHADLDHVVRKKKKVPTATLR